MSIVHLNKSCPWWFNCTKSYAAWAILDVLIYLSRGFRACEIPFSLSNLVSQLFSWKRRAFANQTQNVCTQQFSMANWSELDSDQWLTSCRGSCLMRKHRFIINGVRSDMLKLNESVARELTLQSEICFTVWSSRGKGAWAQNWSMVCIHSMKLNDSRLG